MKRNNIKRLILLAREVRLISATRAELLIALLDLSDA